MRKLKALKEGIKKWRKSGKSKEDVDREILVRVMDELETKAESVGLTEEDLVDRVNSKALLKILDSRRRADLVQKAKVRWDIEGDENSAFFHAYINNKKNASRIHGLSLNGLWVDDPTMVGNEVFNFFATKFDKQVGNRLNMAAEGFSKLSAEDSAWLERAFSMEEVKAAVWSCGGNKSPGPDGFTFRFIQNFWEIIKGDFLEFVTEFHSRGYLETGCNSSFISLIPKVKNPMVLNDYRPINLVGCMSKVVSKLLALRIKKVIHKIVGVEQSAYIKGRHILDGHLVVNELVSWVKKRKKKCLLFKVDFDKAFDSVDWSFLDEVMSHMGFGNKWRMWVMSGLHSGKASVLVNGSPTLEFRYRRGVKQGDPLSPFLFILVMEGLSVAMRKAVTNQVFNGINLPNGGPNISHVIYADDVLFVSEWEEGDLVNLARILRCFFLASGLKVNFHKSKVYGVGVDNADVTSLASILRCEAACLPFQFLGLPIGANMGLSKHWRTIIDKVNGRLNSWKAKVLSFGGRLTLVKSVLGSIPLYCLSMFRAPKGVIGALERARRNFLWGSVGGKNKICWAAWDAVLKPKNLGGLGVGGLDVMNLALLLKWWWRWKSEEGALWVQSVSAIHKKRSGSSDILANKTASGPWANIAKIDKDLRGLGLQCNALFRRAVGRGDKTRFWKDAWFGLSPLKLYFPLLFELEVDKECLVQDRVRHGEDGALFFEWKWRRSALTGSECGEVEDITHLVTSYSFHKNSDGWVWVGKSDGVFSVESARAVLAEQRFGPGDSFLVWQSWLPIKVNGFVWKLLQNKIPVSFNLSSRGVILDSYNCKACHGVAESVSHVFLNCSFAKDIWRKVSMWVGVDLTGWDELDQLMDVAAEMDSSRKRDLLLSILYTTFWFIWKGRNARVFRSARTSTQESLEDIKTGLYGWIINRSSHRDIDWNIWIIDPLSCL
ncbi:putative RNA-directed DNA polymerase [Helianthus annuus]|uniref:RNA-directed DNA polymerase n=1 Tax=Helianthus annuus TaxID=4232 RepID=A0A9K3DVE1_HELAN|nr:putative RNA-directed DNA polymerase [Helianthus annuus]